MKSNVPVNFETFYFIELLTRIQSQGQKRYTQQEFSNLNRFIQYLSEENDAAESIEKLAHMQTTSDLAIFFSDILERLHQTPPTEALDKIPDHVRDFLEIFTVILKDQKWLEYIQQTVAAEEKEEEKEEATGSALSFDEFIRHTIQEKIDQICRQLPEPHRQPFSEFLKHSIEDPSALRIIGEKIQDPVAEEIQQVHQLVLNGNKDVDDLDSYIQNYEHQLENWSRLFLKIYEEYPQNLNSALAELNLPCLDIPEVAEETPAFKEEKETTAETIEVTPEREFEQKKSPPPAASEEEKARRELLKDYVIREIQGFREEILDNLKRFLKHPDQPKPQRYLLDSIKAFKDLGQIHNYPGIELSAQYLLKTVQDGIRESRQFLPDAPPALDNLFEILPDYVHAKLKGEEAQYFDQIQIQLKEISQQLIKVEPAISMDALDNLRLVYQEIVSRHAKGLLNKMAAQSPREWPAETALEISPVFENIKYWAKLLQLEMQAETAGLVEKLFAPVYRSDLSDKEISVIQELIKYWQTSFVRAPGQLWLSYRDQLHEMVNARKELSVEEAWQAFQDVSARQINHLKEKCIESEYSNEEIWQEQLPALLRQIHQNSNLLKNEVLYLFLEKVKEKLAPSYLSAKDLTVLDKSKLMHFLDEFQKQIMQLPEQFDSGNLLNGFDELLSSLPEKSVPEKAEETEHLIAEDQPLPEAAPEKEKTEVISGKQEVTDEEIEKVFQQESKRYLIQIREGLQSLMSNPDDKAIIQRVAVASHTLNGSAQMTGHQELIEFSRPLEDAMDLIQQQQVAPDPQIFNLLSELAGIIEQRISGANIDPTDVLQRLQKQLDQYLVEGKPVVEEDTPGEIVTQAAQEAAGEEPFAEALDELTTDAVVRLKEQDPELLSIFKEEVANNYDVIERNLANLEKFTFDRSAWQEVERAIHEIHGAAKMLGLSEIGEIAHKMEQVVEKVLQEKMDNSSGIIPLLRRVMLVIRQLTEEHQVDRMLYEEADEKLRHVLAGGSIEETAKKPEAPEEEPEIPEEQPAEPAPQIREMFIQEATDLLEDINYILLKLEKNPENTELQHHLMRSIHTLKGSAGVVNAKKMEKLAHLNEDILERYIQLEQRIPADLFDLIFASLDEFLFIIEAYKANRKEKTRHQEDLVKKLENYFQQIGTLEEEETPELTSAESKQESPEVPEEKATPEEIIEEEEFVTKAEEEEEFEIRTSRDTVIRLNIQQMNNLLNLAAELVIGHTQFKNQLDRLKNFTPLLDSELKIFRDTETHLNAILEEQKRIQEQIASKETDPGVKESLKTQLENLERVLKNLQSLQNEILNVSHSLKDNSKTYDESLQKMNKQSNELLDAIMKARMVPINILFQRFQRPIRDIARQFNKKIRLSIKGENTELDRTLIEELYEPLLHIIRNAIDHGIETVEVRKKEGKNVEGLLEIKASRDRNQILIEIRDDGRGISLNKVKEKAIEKGFINEEDAAHLTKQEIFDLLFLPGFSTATEKTLVSGRGVGLDAVKNQLEKIKGDIRIHTEENKGTTFIIRVPVSLSVIQSMLVDVGGHVYSIPLFQVEETLNVGIKNLVNRDGVYYLRYRDKLIPIIQLTQLLTVKGARPRPISIAGVYPAIVVQDEGYRVALLVDKIVRREEILIKSLGPALRRLKYVTGGSIMADGQVVLVLDIPQIIQYSSKLTQSDSKEPTLMLSDTEGKETKAKSRRLRKKIISGRKPIVLVVDDSLSIRKYLSHLLMQKGFITETARNGYEALELLNSRPFDFMITDLEMPKLSGYELIETVRMDERFEEFPIVVLTGRANENIRRMTEDLGADAYIIKPFKDRELFENIQKFIEYDF